MVVDGSLVGPEIHFELRYYFAIDKLFITNVYYMSIIKHFLFYYIFHFQIYFINTLSSSKFESSISGHVGDSTSAVLFSFPVNSAYM